MSAPPEARLWRIAVILQSTEFGGMEVHGIDLAHELADRGHAIVLVAAPAIANEPRVQSLTDSGVEVWTIDVGRGQGRLPQARALAHLAARLARWHPDVVHVQTGWTAGCLPLVATVRLATRARVVVSEHHYPSEPPSRHLAISSAGIDRLAHALIAVSRHNASIRNAYLPPRVRLFAAVLNGIRIDPLDRATQQENRTRVRHELNIAPDAVVVGSAVRLVKEKGLETLLDAFANHMTDRSCRLLLVGDGPLRPQLEQRAQVLGIWDRVIFAGYRSDPAPYLDTMDVFTLPVPKGSMSIALLEAMSRERPAIITFCGPEEAVVPGVTGLGPAPNDAEDLGHAIDQLVGDSAERYRLGTAAGVHVRRNYSVQRMVDDITDVYRATYEGELPARLRADLPAQPFSIDRCLVVESGR
jgi:glycosyltransferase involved in cell wall biosynthesis